MPCKQSHQVPSESSEDYFTSLGATAEKARAPSCDSTGSYTLNSVYVHETPTSPLAQILSHLITSLTGSSVACFAVAVAVA